MPIKTIDETTSEDFVRMNDHERRSFLERLRAYIRFTKQLETALQL